MTGANAGDTRKCQQGFQLCASIHLIERLSFPFRSRLMFQNCSRGPANKSVAVIQMRPCCRNRVGILLAMESFKLMPQVTRSTLAGFGLDHLRRFAACVGHSIQTRLHSTTPNGKVHCAIRWMNDGVRHRQWRAGEKLFFGGCVGRTMFLQMNCVDFAPAPVEHKQSPLILCRKSRAVPKCRAGGRAGTDIQCGWQIVGVEFRILACSVSPAKLCTTDDMVDASRPIP